MNVVFDSYEPGEDIPVLQYLKNRKLQKYFNRETAAAIVGVGKLFREMEPAPETPFYYAAWPMEYEDYGFMGTISRSIDEKGNFSQKRFIHEGMPTVSPLSQFKVLQNMPLSFAAIEYQLTGDNAVVYTSAPGLLRLGLQSVFDGPMLLGAGKTYKDGRVEAGFAYVTREEIKDSSFLSALSTPGNGNPDAVDMFRAWAAGRY
jgi:hypothetical protein